MTRKKLTARQRGYASKSEIAAALRDMAKQTESLPDDTLVKFNINFWYTEDDELLQDGAATQTAGGEG